MKSNTLERKTTDPYALAESLGIHYSGDCNVEYGGLFFSSADWKENGYADALRITDLDSACGFTGGILIERITILRPDDIQSCLDCCGWIPEEATVEMEIDACMSYGHYDPVEDFTGQHTETVTTDPESMEYDGRKASKVIDCEDLLGYLHAEWMGDF